MKKKEFTLDFCVECIRKTGQSCCTGNPALPLMYKDILRIRKLGYKDKDFIAPLWYTEEDVEGPEQWWKDARIKYNGRKYKLNIKKIKGKCFFLKDGVGCTLGNDRPYLCRMYPFWVDEKTGKVIYDISAKEECFIPLKKNSIDEGLKIIKESKKNIKHFFNEVRKDALNNQDNAEKIFKDLKKVKKKDSSKNVNKKKNNSKNSKKVNKKKS